MEECVHTWVSVRGLLQSVHQTVFIAEIFLGWRSFVYMYNEAKVPVWLLGWRP
jgi:hypothetical protein